MALNMDTVPILNDSVGGVKVNVVDDFSQVDPSIPKGEVLLMGQQALNFVQSRWYVGDELNLSRMERQREYMRNFAPAVKAKIQEDAAYAVDTYGKIQDLIVTDCVVDNFARLATEYSSYPMGQILTVPGKNVMGQTYYEFYPDEKALDDMIIKLFYEPKN